MSFFLRTNTSSLGDIYYLLLVKVHNVVAHSIQEILRVRNQHQDSRIGLEKVRILIIYIQPNVMVDNSHLFRALAYFSVLKVNYK